MMPQFCPECRASRTRNPVPSPGFRRILEGLEWTRQGEGRFRRVVARFGPGPADGCLGRTVWVVYGGSRAVSGNRCEIVRARFPEDTELVRRLFCEYAAALPFDLGFQGFERELADLPGDYAPPRGCCLLARVEGEPAGCVALRPLEAGVCEMKRLWVRPPYRGDRVGRLLAERVVSAGRKLGYARMRLDTAPDMTPAIRLYRGLGFVEIAPYRPNPIPGALFFELTLPP